ncbi:unnamed protein product [Scytosiphon promiscuus]
MCVRRSEPGRERIMVIEPCFILALHEKESGLLGKRTIQLFLCFTGHGFVFQASRCCLKRPRACVAFHDSNSLVPFFSNLCRFGRGAVHVPKRWQRQRLWPSD